MHDGVMAKLPVAVYTIYEARYRDPNTHLIAATGLSVLNDIITREAFGRGIPLIDLRLIITEDDDYANDVEPLVKAGAPRSLRPSRRSSRPTISSRLSLWFSRGRLLLLAVLRRGGGWRLRRCGVRR
jgi:hypothetical protein